jgi:hypothetical protein
MGFSGFYELERPGEIYPNDMESGRRCTAAFNAGGKRMYGRKFWPNCKLWQINRAN